MASFVILMKLTAKGAQDVDGATRDVNETRGRLLQPHGITETCWLVTMGRFDMIMVIDAESPDVAGYYATELSRSGFVVTETVPGFEPRYFGEIVFEKGNKTKA